MAECESKRKSNYNNKKRTAKKAIKCKSIDDIKRPFRAQIPAAKWLNRHSKPNARQWSLNKKENNIQTRAQQKNKSKNQIDDCENLTVNFVWIWLLCRILTKPEFISMPNKTREKNNNLNEKLCLEAKQKKFIEFGFGVFK